MPTLQCQPRVLFGMCLCCSSPPEDAALRCKWWKSWRRRGKDQHKPGRSSLRNSFESSALFFSFFFEKWDKLKSLIIAGNKLLLGRGWFACATSHLVIIWWTGLPPISFQTSFKQEVKGLPRTYWDFLSHSRELVVFLWNPVFWFFNSCRGGKNL